MIETSPIQLDLPTELKGRISLAISQRVVAKKGRIYEKDAIVALIECGLSVNGWEDRALEWQVARKTSAELAKK